MSVMASITESASGWMPVARRWRRTRANVTIDAIDDASRPISTRSKMSSLDSHVASRKTTTPMPQPDRHEAWPLQGDDGLGQRDGDHVEGAAERQHGQRPAREVGAEDDVDHQRPEHEGADRADDADGEHDA